MATISIDQLIPQQIGLWKGQLKTAHPNLNEIYNAAKRRRTQIEKYENLNKPPALCWLQDLDEIDATIKSIAEGWLDTNPADLDESELQSLKSDLSHATAIDNNRVAAKIKVVEEQLVGIDFEIIAPKGRKEKIILAASQGNHQLLRDMDPPLAVDEALNIMEVYMKCKAWERVKEWGDFADEARSKKAELGTLMLCYQDYQTGLDTKALTQFVDSVQDIPSFVRGMRRLIEIGRRDIVKKLLASESLRECQDADLLTFRGDCALEAEENAAPIKQALSIDETALTENAKLDDVFTQIFFSNMNTKIDAIYTAASGCGAPTQERNLGIELLKLFFFPAGAVVEWWNGALITKRCQTITELFRSKANIEPHIGKAAELLAERYRSQLKRLDDEGRREFARCAAVRILNYLTLTNEPLSSERFGDEMAYGVQVAPQSRLKQLFDSTVKTTDGVKWTISGIFDYSEIEFDGKAYFIPGVTDEKYGRRGCDFKELNTTDQWKLIPE